MAIETLKLAQSIAKIGTTGSADPSAPAAGGTGFAEKLERSLDAVHARGRLADLDAVVAAAGAHAGQHRSMRALDVSGLCARCAPALAAAVIAAATNARRSKRTVTAGLLSALR